MTEDAPTKRDEAREAIHASLVAWRAAGEKNPLMAVYGDLNGDGIPDFYGLDAHGDLREVDGSRVAWDSFGRPYETADAQ